MLWYKQLEYYFLLEGDVTFGSSLLQIRLSVVYL